MNEVLCRALIRARVTDEDVATRLEVDPKTVRRWLEGRVPHLRHRWAIAMLVDMDQAELWPQLRSAASRPPEVVAVYACRDLVPPHIWLYLIRSAKREAGVLADGEFLLGSNSALLAALAERARSSVLVRVCLADTSPHLPGAGEWQADEEEGPSRTAGIRSAVEPAEYRFSQVRAYNSVCYADEQLLVSQHIYGLPAGRTPILHLRSSPGAELATAYRAGFERIWSSAMRTD